MGWIEKKVDKLVDSTIGKWIYDEKFLIVSNTLDLEERENVVKVSKKVMEKVVYFTTFLSIMLIMLYIYRKIGIEQFVAVLLTLIFIQTVYINRNFKEFMEKFLK